MTYLKSVLQTKRHEALDDFLSRCKVFRKFDEVKIKAIANTTINYLTSSKEKRKTIELDQKLEQRWYDALAAGRYDYDVYNSDDYIAELWACWFVYSKRYILDMQKVKSLETMSISDYLKPIYAIVDLGCGFGYTSAAFKELYPHASVTGTNIENTIQFDVAKNLGKQFGFKVESDLENLNEDVDLVFASEYFEHIEDPIDHLREVVKTMHPGAFLIANAFGTRAVGHFNEYKIDGVFVDAKKVSKLFNEEMKNLGYIKIKTKLWNNRPTFWKHKTTFLDEEENDE